MDKSENVFDGEQNEEIESRENIAHLLIYLQILEFII